MRSMSPRIIRPAPAAWPVLAAAAAALAACGNGGNTTPQGEPSRPEREAEPGAEKQEPGERAASSVRERSGGETSSRETSACLTQDGKAIPAVDYRAIGTEPFWAADIDGRCVTYRTPEDQAGTRIWTNFSGTAERGTWTGALDSQRFVLTTRPEPGCSDGMSDSVYPVAVTLHVRGERRTGCAGRH